MAARTSERRSTPAPRADVERMSRGSSHVVTYQLSNDEIIKYRALPLPPEALARQRKAAEREARRQEKERQEKDMAVGKEGPACGLTKKLFLEQIAAGETVSSIEKAWSMKFNTLPSWVKRWDLKGIKPEQAKAMLEGDVGQSAESPGLTPEQEAVARKLFEAAPSVSEDASSAAVAVRLIEEDTQKDAEIERLQAEVAYLEQRMAADWAIPDSSKKVAELEDRIFAERNTAFAEAQQQKARIKELEEERVMLLQTIEQAARPAFKRGDDPNSTYQALAELGALAPAFTQMESSFLKIARESGELVTQKNAAYGDSFAKSGAFLQLLYPNGIQPEQYGDALCLVRIFDKQMRIATCKDAFDESPYRDIIGYGILGAAKEVQVG